MGLIEVDDLSKTYRSRRGAVKANDAVTIHVEPGRVHGLFGHNGAGKTTLVNQLLGLLKPDAGAIRVDGQDVLATPGLGRFLCSAQPQASVPLGELTPRAITSLMARMRGASEREVASQIDALFERLDIMRWADKPGNQLSGGVLRLACFCMAAIHPGKAVILDEPTNDVDPVRRRYLWGAIRELTNAGAAVLLVTHNISEAESAVDEMTIMDHGKVLAQGNAARIKAQTVGDSMRLLARTWHPYHTFGPLPWASEVSVSNEEISVLFPAEQISEAVSWAVRLRQQRRLGEYSLRETSLEDTYVKIVGARQVDGDGI